jgi:hypothetical protein
MCVLGLGVGFGWSCVASRFIGGWCEGRVIVCDLVRVVFLCFCGGVCGMMWVSRESVGVAWE